MALPIMSGQAPGPLGINAVSGLNMGLLVGSPVRANIWTRVARQAAKEVGKEALKQGLKKASSKMLGKMLTRSKDWVVAFAHIAEHFSLKAITGKGQHTVFVAALRSKAALEPIIAQAAKNSSQKFISKAAVRGNLSGRPLIFIEKEFGTVLGETFEEVVKDGVTTIVKKSECRILRIIVDLKGKPITAYPIRVFKAGM